MTVMDSFLNKIKKQKQKDTQAHKSTFIACDMLPAGYSAKTDLFAFKTHAAGAIIVMATKALETRSYLYLSTRLQTQLGSDDTAQGGINTRARRRPDTRRLIHKTQRYRCGHTLNQQQRHFPSRVPVRPATGPAGLVWATADRNDMGLLKAAESIHILYLGKTMDTCVKKRKTFCQE